MADDGGHFFLLYLFLLELLVEGSSIHVLQHNVQVRLIVEKPIHLQDITVPRAALDSYLKG